MSARIGSVALCALLASAGLASCGPSHHTYAEYGAQLARSTEVADNRYNAFTCLTCHAEHASDVGTRAFPGAVLETAALRTSWWGGTVLDLDVAVNNCFTRFMGGARLDPNGDTAQALNAWLMDLASHAPTMDPTPVPFTVPPGVHDIAPGDATRGEAVYRNACRTCHGDVHTGAGHIGTASIVPDDTNTEHAGYGPACLRVTFIEKIRHGSFLGFAGVMPPFSEEALTDAQVADLLAYIGAPAGGECSP